MTKQEEQLKTLYRELDRVENEICEIDYKMEQLTYDRDCFLKEERQILKDIKYVVNDEYNGGEI